MTIQHFLARRIGGHLKTLQAISCIRYILLYDWPSHLREQINRTLQFRNCHGSSFVLFYVSMETTLGQLSGYTQKTSLRVGKRYLPMSKRASVTTIYKLTFSRSTKVSQEGIQIQPNTANTTF